jgi:hypothetical protein
MSEQSREKDPGMVWRGQPEEKLPVNLHQLVNRRTQELYSSTRSEIIMSVLAALFFIAVLSWRLGPDQHRLQHLGIAVTIVWILASLYRFRDRIWRKDRPGRDALAATGVEYYRKELERRRDHLRNEWLWHGPLFLASTILVATILGKVYPGPERLLSALPLIILLVGWTAAGMRRRRHQASGLQRDIDEIDRLSDADM